MNTPPAGSIERALERARGLDLDDPLGPFRDEFFIPHPDRAYLDGNSLGMAPAATIQRVTEVMTGEWADDLIASWDHWIDLPRRVGDTLAPLIGANPGEVVVHDSTTINLYQLVTAAMRLSLDSPTSSPVIAVDPDEFPTDRYIVEELATQFGWEVQHGFDRLDRVGVGVRSVIDYRTAEVVDIAAEQAHADSTGTIMVWDLSHTAGLYPVDLNAIGAQLAVGCTYKFLNGGPGAPGFSFVQRALIGRLDQPIHGWFSQHDQFAMDADYRQRLDIGRLLIGTPSILSLAAAEVGIAVSARAGIGPIYAKSQRLGEFAIELIDTFDLDTSTPRDPARRGGHVAILHPKARQVVTQLATDHDVIADYRDPNVIRLGMSPLTTRFIDVARAITAIAAEAIR